MPDERDQALAVWLLAKIVEAKGKRFTDLTPEDIARNAAALRAAIETLRLEGNGAGK